MFTTVEGSIFKISSEAVHFIQNIFCFLELLLQCLGLWKDSQSSLERGRMLGGPKTKQQPILFQSFIINNNNITTTIYFSLKWTTLTMIFGFQCICTTAIVFKYAK
jgi:hypothetical protein